MEDNLPLVSVIIPCKNEEKYLKECLNSLLNQKYPQSHIEILVMDGRSTDNTKGIVKEQMLTHSNIYLLDNPKIIITSGLNIGVKRAMGDIIIIMNGHSFLDPDFIFEGVKYLQKKPDIDCVGGTLKSIGENFISKVIALATLSRFGAGNAYYKYGTEEKYVDTVPFGAYRRKVFEKVGLFNEKLKSNDDYEFNCRIRKNKGKILFTPKIKAFKYMRGSLKRLFFQYFEYGFWKLRAVQSNVRFLAWRQLVPPFFLSSLLVSLVLGIFFNPFLILFFSIFGIYFFCLLIISFNIALKNHLNYFLYLLIIFLIIHFAFAFGFLVGFFNVIFYCIFKLSNEKDLESSITPKMS